MTNIDSKKGLQIGSKAPPIDTVDIYGKKIVMIEILQSHRGLLIDFFRGAW